jgi:hypothetical protein
VEVAAAAGVIGTGDHQLRAARLAQGNPLGLIYIPFALPSLPLVSCRSA